MKIKPDFKIMDRTQLEVPIQQIIEEDTKEFLRSCRGLQYLRMRFPGYTLQEAVGEYKQKVLVGLNF